VKICSVEDCNKTVHCKELCKNHYEQKRHNRKMLEDSEYRARYLERSRRAHSKEDPEKRAEQNLNWSRENKDKRKISRDKRLKLRRIPDSDMVINKAEIWKRDQGVCGICSNSRGPVDETNWHLDHIIPVSKGGLHTLENVQVSHPFCNLSKKDKILN